VEAPGARRPLVAVAMSGGVDSSVAAALCVEAGYEVFGVMLRLWSEPGGGAANKCCTLGAIDDARAVADRLAIPFSVLDASEAFHERVVGPFLDEAAAGLTPNPCFTCNRRMRFGYLLDRARALGADFLATGHYARVGRAPDGRLRLRRGLDAAKDQSYVLYALDADQLAHALFPVGGYEKAEVRRLARRFGLRVAARPDSVDLCWVGEGGLSGFLGRHLPPGAARPGPILDPSGAQVGRHEGLPFYTLGQRRGLGVALGAPAYVVGRDMVRNALCVGPAEALGRRTVRVGRMHWTGGEPPPPGARLRVEAKVRYGGPSSAATLWVRADRAATVRFDAPVRAPTAGQGLVAYVGDEVLGGGPIAPQRTARGRLPAAVDG